MEVMRKKSVKDKHPRQEQKTVTKWRKKSSQLPTPSSANIRKYLVRKNREDENTGSDIKDKKLSEDNHNIQDNRDISIKKNDCDNRGE